MTDSIYLDHNSTSPIDSDVVSAMTECYRLGYANPASQHRAGQAARSVLENHRRQIVELLGGCSQGMATDQLVFTSGGTESNNLAIFGLAALGKSRLLQRNALAAGQKPLMLISAVEHPSISLTVPKLKSMGYEVQMLPVDRNGLIQMKTVESLLDQPIALVSVMLANNETGVIQPIEAIVDQCKQRNILVHTDGVQAIGKISVDFGQLNVDALSFTAHKFAGPRGIGGLLLRHNIAPEPILFGGFQQTAIRPGTEDVCLVVGMSTALNKFAADVSPYHQHLATLRDRLQNQLRERFPNVVINGIEAPRVPQTLNVSFRGIDRQSFLMAADMAGLAISTGSACASGSSDPSPVLVAMELDPDAIQSAVRFSFGYSNTESQVDDALLRIEKIVARLNH